MREILLSEEQTNSKIVALLNRKSKLFGLDEEFGKITLDTFNDVAFIGS